MSAKNYIGGKVVVFGTSCRESSGHKKRFATSVNNLAEMLGEGDGFHEQSTFQAKDSKLDLVAWKGFNDERPSQVILFGQCAAGGNWTEKLTELNPRVFWDQWMSRGRVSSLLRSVFIPHRVHDAARWEMRARAARLLFDRSRVVSLADRKSVV